MIEDRNLGEPLLSEPLKGSWFCDVLDCPIHIDSDKREVYNVPHISANIIGNIKILVPLPCLVCSNLKKVDLGTMLKRENTKQMLKEKNHPYKIDEMPKIAKNKVLAKKTLR